MFEKNIQESFMISEYINKYVSNTLSVEERANLDSWLAASPKNLELFNKLQNVEYRSSVLRQFNEYPTVQAYDNVQRLIGSNHSKSIFNISRISWAAAVIVVCLVSGYYIYNDSSKDNLSLAAINIKPAMMHARLSVIDGKDVDLDTIKNGSSVQLGTFAVSKNKKGVLQILEAEDATSHQLSTIFSPKGSRYDFILADGTHVWLNAESSIRFPARFSNRERNVETTGEVYFEVAHVTNRRKELIPFTVRSAQQLVTVLGTHFNLSAYPGEDVNTTLLEGKVSVKAGGTSTLLAPGEMLVNATTGTVHKEKANLEAVMAWKEGTFYFEQEPLEYIMNQLARWYNLDVSYEQESLKNQRFSGTISREGSVVNLLRIMEETDVVHFKIEGRRIFVTR